MIKLGYEHGWKIVIIPACDYFNYDCLANKIYTLLASSQIMCLLLVPDNFIKFSNWKISVLQWQLTNGTEASRGRGCNSIVEFGHETSRVGSFIFESSCVEEYCTIGL